MKKFAAFDLRRLVNTVKYRLVPGPRSKAHLCNTILASHKLLSPLDRYSLTLFPLANLRLF
jgi:hypothetical protein